MKMKSSEIAILMARNLASNLIEYIKDTLLQASIIQECPKDTFLDVKIIKKIMVISVYEESSRYSKPI